MAEGRIKGITIEIDGDVTGLNKALESTTKELRSTQKQLNDVNRLLKLDPTNTELLSQKQRLLGDTIKSTRDKLDTLKKAQEQAAAKLETGGKEAQEQYEALRREIISTEIDLGKLEGQAEDTEKALNDAGNNGAGSIEEAGDAAKDAENKVSGFGSAAKAAGVAAAAAFAAATAAAVSLGKDVIESYGEYEQLVGGIDTLFKDSSAMMQEYANNAYKTAGMSANDYMSTATSFSASLIQSLGGDTEAAVKYADMAITDMADNANKMGTDIGLIQNAYQGFAKQNYTMLDNLKLGYGGTKEEMERLLADATAISGIEYDISSYADVVDAIHVIQESMGVAGATAAEAEHTIEGSMNSMKAAVANLVVGFGDADADIEQLCNNVSDAFQDVLANITPIIENIIASLPTAMNALLETVSELLPTLLEIGGEIVFSIADGIIDNIPKITDAAVSVIYTLASGLINSLPQLISAAVSLLKSLLNAIVDNIPEIIDGIIAAAMAIVDSLPEIIDAIIAALPKIISALIKALPKIIKAIADATSKLAPMLIESGADLADALIDGIIEVFSDPVELISAIGELAISIVGSLFDGLFSLIRKIDKPSISKQVLSSFPSEKESQKAGETTGGGFAKGLSKSRAAIENAANEAAKAVVTKAKIAAQEVEEETAAIINSAAEAAEVFAAMHAQTATDFSETQSYYAHIADLTDELFSLADANGKVEDADRSRVEFILGELNGALGTEYQLVGNVISQYGTLEASIYDVIDAKRANALLEAYSDDYYAALKSKGDAVQAAVASQELYNAKLAEYNALQQEIARQEAIDPESVDPNLYAKSEYARAELAEAENAYLQAVDNLQQYEATVQKYEGAMTKVLEGDYKGAEEILYSTVTLIDKSERAMIDARKNSAEEYRQDWQDALSQGGNTAAKYAKTYADVMEDLNATYREALGLGDKITEGMVEGLDDGGDPLAVKMSEIILSILGAAKDKADEARDIGENIGQGIADGIESKTSVVKEKAGIVARVATEEMKKAFGIASPSKVTTQYGVYLDAGLADGLGDGMGEVLRAAEDIADSVLSRLSFDPTAYGDFGAAALMNAPTSSNYSTVYNNSTSLGGISVYVSAPNVENVEDLADLVADRINTDIINRQAVYG